MWLPTWDDLHVMVTQKQCRGWSSGLKIDSFSPASRADVKDVAASTTQITKTAFQQPQNLPPSPANYNVPLTRKLIYFSKPEGSIVPKGFSPEPVARTSFTTEKVTQPNFTTEKFTQLNFATEKVVQQDFATEKINTLNHIQDFGNSIDMTLRRRRNSKLVRRYKSFADVFLWFA